MWSLHRRALACCVVAGRRWCTIGRACRGTFSSASSFGHACRSAVGAGRRPLWNMACLCSRAASTHTPCSPRTFVALPCRSRCLGAALPEAVATFQLSMRIQCRRSPTQPRRPSSAVLWWGTRLWACPFTSRTRAASERCCDGRRASSIGSPKVSAGQNSCLRGPPLILTTRFAPGRCSRVCDPRLCFEPAMLQQASRQQFLRRHFDSHGL
mmetsp:Transcript_64195/g.179537  ORF Transcript_64195/g.179537 Transcript_64195/m.179537 type:complete len:211 (-) Transcript_64195:244-876(-)